MKGRGSEEEEIGIRKCSRRSRSYIINEVVKVRISEEQEIVISNRRKVSRVYIINEEVKGWTSSPKQQEAPPEPINTKEVIYLEDTKRKV